MKEKYRINIVWGRGRSNENENRFGKKKIFECGFSGGNKLDTRQTRLKDDRVSRAEASLDPPPKTVNKG